MEITKASFTSLTASNLQALHNLIQKRLDPKDILLADDIVGASEHGDGDSCAEFKARAHSGIAMLRDHIQVSADLSGFVGTLPTNKCQTPCDSQRVAGFV